ncbi:MAG: hypothetical protein IKA69_04145 [Kiritimatiellae bacterium]|nr:hypothetical protein [Kiritimatiellia bacterium]
MARHEVVIHQNTGATSESAPYTGNYISKETVGESAFAEAVASKCGLPAIQVAAIIDGAFEAFEELESAGLVRVHTDLGVVCGVISGSFPTSDVAFDPERNSLELALRLDDSIRLSLSDVTPKIVTDETVTKLRVDNVMDIEEERPMNLIHGRHVFRVAGLNMVLGDEGAAIYLQDKNGTTFPVAVDEVVSKQLFKAHTAELIPAGDYKLVVKSRAGDAAGPLQTAFRRVKYLRVEDPEPIGGSTDGTVQVFTQTDNGQSETFHTGNDHEWRLTGKGLFGTADGSKWRVENISVVYQVIEGSPYFVDVNPTFAADGKSATFKVTGIPADTYSNAFIGVTLVDKNDPATTDSFRLPRITLVASGS